MESDETCLTIAPILFYSVHGRFRLVHEIWVKYIELVALNNFRRGVIVIVVSLVVFVPLVSGMHPIEILRLSRAIFIMPPVHLHEDKRPRSRHHLCRVCLNIRKIQGKLQI